MTIADKVDTLEALNAGRMTVADAAQKWGVTEAEVARWQDIYAVSAELSARSARADGARRSRTARRATLTAAVALALVGGVWGSQTAWAQVTCTQTLPAPLVTFCPDSPALASSVNGNLQQLVNWTQQKVGPVGTADVTVTGNFNGANINGTNISGTNVTASGRVTTPIAYVNGPVVRGTVAPNTGDLGLYSQVSGNYVRFVSNAAPFYFYSDGNVSTNYAGSNVNLGIEDNGNVTVRGQLAAGSLRARSCAWGPRGPGWGDDSSYHSVYCPAGQYMAGWQCKANGYLDGDCAAWCCYP